MTVVVLAIARASVLEAPVPVLQGPWRCTSSQIPCLIRCIIISTIMLVKERMISIVTMHSSMLRGLFLDLAPLAISLPRQKGIAAFFAQTSQEITGLLKGRERGLQDTSSGNCEDHNSHLCYHSAEFAATQSRGTKCTSGHIALPRHSAKGETIVKKEY
ncbi:hypothetical protein H5410_052592 [Solanum commersonii]|uniref:Uncharacterized protein n=1 Tax=Solanum commersonii TaxID=4109 RepID=A0A9J5X3H0_SOLCO|nr:hypothetical protein H5410_052592 [Solanum commersonii]